MEVILSRRVILCDFFYFLFSLRSFKKIFNFIYLAVLGVRRSTQDL